MSNAHEREVAIFDAAHELPLEQQEAYLLQTCGNDQELIQRVRSLLNANEKQTDFLVPASNAAVSSAPREKPGDRIGPYKLLQLIGEGGCGVVYMAEQDKPIHRRVALKIIKLGMDTKQVIARFEAERQALALMDHPNIAKVHDTGATATGRPYFVMELVRGVRITDYCDEKKLTTRQRLELFIQVCQAVQHAHQKGIIHRDLKPSNILVTVNDGTAVAKVIDFGIAKATTGERLTDKTLFTAFEQFIGTPAYVSPEQAEITSVDIDTRSDIYSLGVLLYELLTGQTPFDARELLEAGLEQMRRTLREKEPARPSTRLSTLGAEELTNTATRRGLEAPKLVSLLRGDLDWIVMKCLEKDRARRYETANGLVMDLERHLENEPVLARPPSAFYRFQKMARRNKLAFTAAGLVFLTLALGFGVSIWSFGRERQARQQAVLAEGVARAQGLKSQQVARFLEDMLRSIDPEIAMGRDTSLLRQVLDKTSARVTADLTNQPLVEAELQNTIAGVYGAIGDLTNAEAMARSAVALRRRFLGDEDPSLADSLASLANHLWHEGRGNEAEAPAREALAIRRKAQATHPLSNSLHLLAVVLADQGRSSEAESLVRESLALDRALLGDNDPSVASKLNTLSGILLDQGKLLEAERTSREAFDIYRDRSMQQDPGFAHLLGNLANILFEQGRYSDAEPYFREALAICRKYLGDSHERTAVAVSCLASDLRHQEKFADAEPLYRECLAFREKKLPDAWYTFYTRSQLGATLLAEKKYAEAEPLLIAGYAGMKEREAHVRLHGRVFSEVLAALIQLYEATSQPAKATSWRTTLAQLEQGTPKSSNSPGASQKQLSAAKDGN